jgi:hypothetical protein
MTSAIPLTMPGAPFHQLSSDAGLPPVPFMSSLPDGPPSYIQGNPRSTTLRTTKPSVYPEAVKRTVKTTAWQSSYYSRNIMEQQVVFTVGRPDSNGRETIMNIPQLNELFSLVYSDKMEQQKGEVTDYDKVPELKVALQDAGSVIGGESWVDRSSVWVEDYIQQIKDAPESAFKAGVTADGRKSQDRKEILEKMMKIREEEEKSACLLKSKVNNMKKGEVERRAFETLKGVCTHVRYSGVINNVQAGEQLRSEYKNQLLAIAIASGGAQVANTFNVLSRLDVGTRLFVYLTRHKDHTSGKYTAFKLVTWGDKDFNRVPENMLTYIDDAGTLQVGKSWCVGEIKSVDDGKGAPREIQLKALGLSSCTTSVNAVGIMASMVAITLIQGKS